MNKKITFEMVKSISKNLTINLSENEINILIEELETSINDLEKLSIFRNKFSIENVEPMNFPNIKCSPEFREDIVEEFDNKNKLLDNPKEFIKGLVKV